MVYNFVDSHKDIITVQFGETVKDANGNHVPGQFDATNKTITFLNGQAPSSSTTIEEIYHSYQNLTPSSEDATTNFEFEAKTFTIFSSIEAGCSFDISNLTDYYNFVMFNMFSPDNKLNINNPNQSFESQYISFGKQFTDQYVGNKTYSVPVTFIPQRISTTLNFCK